MSASREQPSPSQAASPAEEVMKLLPKAQNTDVSRKHLSDLLIDITEYTKIKLVGCGAFGKVSLYEKEGSVIAAKFMPVIENSQKIFDREIESLWSLSPHPFIVSLRGFSLPSPINKERFVIAMEYISGGSLLDVLKNPPQWFDNRSKSKIICGIAFAMAFVHSKGIIYRNLKPGNVLLDENHLPHICDFGSSCLSSIDVAMIDLPGVTPVYQAPEVYEGDYTMKIDVYSFGIMLYEIVTGKVAFRGLNMMQLFKHVALGKREPIPDSVTPFTRDLIEKCWAQDPELRPSFDEICSLLEKNSQLLF